MRDKYALTRRSPSRLLAPPAAALKEGVVPSSNLEHDRAYFQAYSHVGIHEEMIKVCLALALCTPSAAPLPLILVVRGCREYVKLFVRLCSGASSCM
jgi:hypothetical protein